MRIKQFLILLLISLQLWAFKSPSSEPEYKLYHIQNLAELKSDMSMEEFLSQYVDLAEGEGLMVRNEVNTAHARHLQYNHLIQDKIVVSSGLNIHIYANGSALIQSYLLNSNEFQLILEEGFDYLVPFDGYLISANKSLNSNLKEEQWEFTSSNGLLLHSEDKYRYYKDTTVKANVFMVNPVNSAQTSYGGMYVDNGDQTNDSLNKQLFEVEMYARFDNDSFYLEHDILKFSEVSGPYLYDKYKSPTDSFLYNRSQKRFEAVNAYYHIIEYYNYLKDIGYDSLVKLTKIDVHAIGGDDNSRFDPDLYTLEFGDGNVDDAEDIEVVLHEYTHGLSTTASYTTGNSRQRNAMEEGNCDYIAKSYSRSINDYNSYDVFSWDGHNEFWSGFTINSDDHYPEDLQNSRNGDRDMWSSFLMCIYDYIGRAATDSLVLEHLSYQYASSKMPEMADILLHIDSVLFNSRNYSPIKECMVHRGFVEYTVGVGTAEKNINNLISNSLAFATATGALKINTDESYEIVLYNQLGQVLLREKRSGNSELSPQDFPPGMYILQVHIAGQVYNYKLLR